MIATMGSSAITATHAVVVAGTRPEVIKLSRLLSAFDRRGITYAFLHGGQHRDHRMFGQFVQDLGLPAVTSTLGVTSESPAAQTAEIMMGVEQVLLTRRPRVVIVQGDTNTTLAAGLAAVKQHVPLGHVEAGLRSYDWRMPEEHNRRMLDHISTLLFAPTLRARATLLAEQVDGSVLVTGNTVVDAVLHYLPLAVRHSKVMEHIRFDEYVLATFHRQENVDRPDFLRGMLDVLEALPLPVVVPLHPRTRRRLAENGLLKRLTRLGRKVQVLPALGYFDFLVALKSCRLILTDSGGLVEEATVPGIRKPSVVVRCSTERPEAIEAGFARLAGVSPEKIVEAVRASLEEPLPRVASPFGDGRASERIAAAVEDFLGHGVVAPKIEQATSFRTEMGWLTVRAQT